MQPRTYLFTDGWVVPAERNRVYALLEDVGSYPGWWPQVKTVEQVDESTAAVACRSVLPYTLRFRMAAVRRSPETGVLEATLDGDLVGTCRWELTAVDGGTRVEFVQLVTTPGRILRLAGRVARPLLVLNHRLMMRQARRGLAGRITG